MFWKAEYAHVQTTQK